MIKQSLLGTVHQTDCVDLMSSLPDCSATMIFADPPFNLNKKYNIYNDSLSFDEYMAWTERWVKECIRILTDDGSLFIYNIPKLLVHTVELLNEDMVFRHWISWNSNGRPLGSTLQPAHYGILFYTKTENSKFFDVRTPHSKCRNCDEYLTDYGGKEHLRHPFGYQISDVWNDIHRVRHNNRRIEGHPCQLPVHLVERIILLSTEENDVIYDPFCGGGSVAIAAKQMGRNYIGSDIDEAYCKVANERYQAAQKVKDVDGSYVSVHLGKVVSIQARDV